MRIISDPIVPRKFFLFKRKNCAILYEIKYTVRACDGIGRHAGFRFPCFQRVGSSPFRRTKKIFFFSEHHDEKSWCFEHHDDRRGVFLMKVCFANWSCGGIKLQRNLAEAEDDYLLTTKLYCGKCGSFMVGESGTSHTMKVHRYYRCVNTKKKKLCDKKAVKKDWIEDLVVNYTMKAIMNDEVMERLIDTLMELQKKESTDLPLLKKQLAETEKGINNMLNAIQAGIFTPSTKQRLDELEETKSQLEVSILQEEMHKPLLTREQIAFFIYRFRKFDVTKREQRQRLIDSFVNAVYLYEDKIILTFNYKDGSKTITLAEVEGSDLSVLGAPEGPVANRLTKDAGAKGQRKTFCPPRLFVRAAILWKLQGIWTQQS